MAQAQSTRQTVPAQPGVQHITLDEYLALLDEAGYEVIDGELVPMSPDALSSKDVAHVLYDSLLEFVVRHKLGRVRMEAPFALDVDPGQGWVRGSLVPDIAFISTDKLRQQKALQPKVNAYRVPPNLAVEVVSPTDAFSNVERKVRRFLGYGVPLIWVVDPQNLFVRVYSPDRPEGHTLNQGETLTGDPVLPGWSMSLAELFAILSEE